MHDFGRGRVTGEAVFVPRTPDAVEDDGWVMSIVYDATSDSSQLKALGAGLRREGEAIRRRP